MPGFEHVAACCYPPPSLAPKSHGPLFPSPVWVPVNATSLHFALLPHFASSLQRDTLRKQDPAQTHNRQQRQALRLRMNVLQCIVRKVQRTARATLRSRLRYSSLGLCCTTCRKSGSFEDKNVRVLLLSSIAGPATTSAHTTRGGVSKALASVIRSFNVSIRSRVRHMT